MNYLLQVAERRLEVLYDKPHAPDVEELRDEAIRSIESQVAHRFLNDHHHHPARGALDHSLLDDYLREVADALPILSGVYDVLIHPL